MQSYKSYDMVSPQTVYTYPFSPCKATNLTTWCHRKQSLLILFHHAMLQILRHGVTVNSLYLSFFTMQSYKSYDMVSPQTGLYLSFFTMQCYKSYDMVSPQTVFTYPFSPCKATNLTTWCHRKQSLLILFTMQSYTSYYMVSPQTVFTYPFSPCKATNLTTWCHRKQSLLILFTMQSYTSYYMYNAYFTSEFGRVHGAVPVAPFARTVFIFFVVWCVVLLAVGGFLRIFFNRVLYFVLFYVLWT